MYDYFDLYFGYCYYIFKDVNELFLSTSQSALDDDFERSPRGPRRRRPRQLVPVENIRAWEQKGPFIHADTDSRRWVRHGFQIAGVRLWAFGVFVFSTFLDTPSIAVCLFGALLLCQH